MWWTAIHLPPRLENKASLMQLKPPPLTTCLFVTTPRPPPEIIWTWNVDFFIPTNDFTLVLHVYLSLNIHRIGLPVFKLYIDGIIKWSEVTQSCPTLCDPMDWRPPGSSVHGIFQARVLEWVAISFSRGSSRPRDRTRVSWVVGRRFTIGAKREAWQAYKTSVLFSACCSFSVVFAWFIHVDMCSSSWSLFSAETPIIWGPHNAFA